MIIHGPLVLCILVFWFAQVPDTADAADAADTACFGNGPLVLLSSFSSSVFLPRLSFEGIWFFLIVRGIQPGW